MATCEEHREVKETLGKIFGKLETITVVQAETGVKLESMSSGIKRIQETLVGNGKPGIVEEVHSLDRSFRDARRDIDQLRDWRYGPGADAARLAGDFGQAKASLITRVAPWLFAVLTAMLGAVIAHGYKP